MASCIHSFQDLSILIDLGTNGEVILGDSDWRASVSCAFGPAFEEACISSGMRAMSGAIESVDIDPEICPMSWTTVGDVPPMGICGSVIIDAAAMARAGILDIARKLIVGKSGVRVGLGGPEYLLVPKDKTSTGRDIVITTEDIAYLMDSKAALLGSIDVLLKKYPFLSAI